nr:MAG TPA: odorant binding protein [Caudoviricetes sp.]
MSQRRKTDGSLKLHRQKPREDNLATGCLFRCTMLKIGI